MSIESIKNNEITFAGDWLELSLVNIGKSLKQKNFPPVSVCGLLDSC
jgi:hypothetical protein